MPSNVKLPTDDAAGKNVREIVDVPDMVAESSQDSPADKASIVLALTPQPDKLKKEGVTDPVVN